jgi:hypothetical protein
MEIDRVFDGIVRFLDREFYNNMNDIQKGGVKFFVRRMRRAMINNKFSKALDPNSFLGSLLTADENGNVDVEGIYEDARETIREMGKLRVTIPLLDTFTFTEADVDNLYRSIMGG